MTRPPRTLSAGIVPFKITDQGVRFLILRSFNYWDFPKGEVEPGEDPLEAAVREMQEESGLVDPQFVHGKNFYDTEPYSKGKVARYFLAQISADQKVVMGISKVLGVPEHQEYRWASAEECEYLFGPRLFRVLAWAKGKLGIAPPNGGAGN
ncbi:bis(5'-nucleosyl)-tetraphosphatase [Bdellovibrio sp. GT3]|uniref:bis(5'-nucleosyl)-tetraphosphatase n=1 Tax=Bdellovibrio sp. GT3 TaxID=3136282 RepID=UPI0030F22D92